MSTEISAVQRSSSSNSLSCGEFLEIKMTFSKVSMNTKVVDIFEYYKIESKNFQFGIRKVDLSFY